MSPSRIPGGGITWEAAGQIDEVVLVDRRTDGTTIVVLGTDGGEGVLEAAWAVADVYADHGVPARALVVDVGQHSVRPVAAVVLP